MKKTIILILATLIAATGYEALAQTSHYFGITPETCTVDVPSLPGKYWLIIDSPALYAEGPFLIN